MLAYRISIDKNEILSYKSNQIYYKKNEIFNTNKNSLYKVNTFKNNSKKYKYFYYFPQDAFEISKIILSINKTINNVHILEYEINNYDVYDKFGFGNYKNLKRKDYIPKNKIYKITPYEDSTYPVLEIKMNINDNINITNNIFKTKINDTIPNDLNKLKKLREYILYKIYLEKVLNDFNINYPHNSDGLMIISKYNNNIKKIILPKKYQRIVC